MARPMLPHPHVPPSTALGPQEILRGQQDGVLGSLLRLAKVPAPPLYPGYPLPTGWIPAVLTGTMGEWPVMSQTSNTAQLPGPPEAPVLLPMDFVRPGGRVPHFTFLELSQGRGAYVLQGSHSCCLYKAGHLAMGSHPGKPKGGNAPGATLVSVPVFHSVQLGCKGFHCH